MITRCWRIDPFSAAVNTISNPPVSYTHLYSTYDGDNEAAGFIAEKEAETAAKGEPKKKKVLVFGSGPIRIGQGIEFDYCSVHCVWTLKKNGCEAILVNNNPETVSTDFDTGDRLYFDPLNPESVDNIIACLLYTSRCV